MSNFYKKRKLLRLRDILGCQKRGIQPIVPCSKTKWYGQIRKGKAPKCVRVDGSSYWYDNEVDAYVESLRK